MRKYQMICCDLDGTLLNTAGEVSAENLRAVEELAARGVFFVPSTGRSFSEMPEALRRHPAIRYFLCSNGAVVQDAQTGRKHLTGILWQVSQKVQAILGRYKAHLTLRHDGKCHVDMMCATNEVFDDYNVFEAHRVVVKSFAVKHKDFAAFCGTADDVEAFCVFFSDYAELLSARKEIENIGGLRVTSVDKYNLEIMNAEAGKGNALLWLAEALGIEREETISVGDSDNDSSMLQAAGLGLAVSNACQALKNVADEMICSNDEHAIMYIAKAYDGFFPR